MVSIVSPEDIKVTIAQAGADPFSTTATAYAELTGIGGVSVKLGEKPLDLVVTYGTTTTNRFHVIEKPAGLVEVSLDNAVFNIDELSAYFYSSGSGVALRATSTLVLGIQLTRGDAQVAKHKFDNARVTSMEFEGDVESQIKGDMSLQCSPIDYSFTVA